MTVRVESLEFTVRRSPGYALNRLREVRVENRHIRPGDEIEVTVSLLRYHGEPFEHRVRVPIPTHVRSGDRLSLLLGDAETVARVDGLLEMPVTSLEGMVDRWRDRPSNRNLYIRLQQPAGGMHVEGRGLHGLPPSVLAQFRSNTHHFVRRPLEESTLWEELIPVEGQFQGNYRITITID